MSVVPGEQQVRALVLEGWEKKLWKKDVRMGPSLERLNLKDMFAYCVNSRGRKRRMHPENSLQEIQALTTEWCPFFSPLLLFRNQDPSFQDPSYFVHVKAV